MLLGVVKHYLCILSRLPLKKKKEKKTYICIIVVLRNFLVCAEVNTLTNICAKLKVNWQLLFQLHSPARKKVTF